MAHPFCSKLPATALVAALSIACGGDKSDSAPSADATKSAAPTETRTPSPEGKPAEAPKPPKAVAGVPAPADLSKLAALAGPKAEGNVAEDIAAAEKAKACKIVEGELADCDAAEDAFRSASNNFVVAKAPAHVQTVFNLLAHESASVRMLVLDAHPMQYLEFNGDDIEDKTPLYRGVLAAAAAETDPAVRGSFAWAITDVPEDSVEGLVGILGAIAERYRADEDGDHIVVTLADRCRDDATPCRDALLGVAARNPDPRMQLKALEKLEWMDPAPEAKVWCSLVVRTLDQLADDDDVSTATGLLTGEEIDCAAHFDTWLSQLPGKAKAGKLTYSELNAAMGLADREGGESRVPKLRELGKQLQGIVGADHDLRAQVDELAALEKA